MEHERVDSHEQSGGVSMESNRRSDDPMSLKFAEAIIFAVLDASSFRAAKEVNAYVIQTHMSSVLVREVCGCAPSVY